MINQNGGVTIKNITYNFQLTAHSISNASDPYWTTSGSRIKYDPVKKIWFKNYGNFTPASIDLRQFWQQQRLFNGNSDIELGGTSNNAKNETITSANQGIINMVCCAGPDAIYQQNFATQTVFGTQCSNTFYTQETILTLSIKGARTLAITYSGIYICIL